VKRLIAIDFDGVIRIDDKPAGGVFEALNKFKNKGYEVVIFTSRNLKEVRKFLRTYGFPNIRATHSKPDGACAYIDDRAIKFTSWRDVIKGF